MLHRNVAVRHTVILLSRACVHRKVPRSTGRDARSLVGKHELRGTRFHTQCHGRTTLCFFKHIRVVRVRTLRCAHLQLCPAVQDHFTFVVHIALFGAFLHVLVAELGCAAGNALGTRLSNYVQLFAPGDAYVICVRAWLQLIKLAFCHAFPLRTHVVQVRLGRRALESALACDHDAVAGALVHALHQSRCHVLLQILAALASCLAAQRRLFSRGVIYQRIILRFAGAVASVQQSDKARSVCARDIF